MANDFNKAQPTKNEKMFFELAMQLHDVDQRVWSISSHVLALGVLLGIDTKKMAEMLTGDDSKLKEYAEKINTEIQKIQAEKGVKPHDHSHHDHSHHDHQH